MGGVNRIEFWAEEEVRSDSALLPGTDPTALLEQRRHAQLSQATPTHDGLRLESSR
ncbi:hypothetical protein ACRRTK_024309 [Alexandromys fortis]